MFCSENVLLQRHCVYTTIIPVYTSKPPEHSVLDVNSVHSPIYMKPEIVMFRDTKKTMIVL